MIIVITCDYVVVEMKEPGVCVRFEGCAFYRISWQFLVNLLLAIGK